MFKSRTLLDAVKEVDAEKVKNKEFETIIKSIENRITTLEWQEPESCGETHDNWEEKYDELTDLLDWAESILDYTTYKSEEDFLEDIDNWKDEMEMYQINYGGIKRWKI